MGFSVIGCNSPATVFCDSVALIRTFSMMMIMMMMMIKIITITINVNARSKAGGARDKPYDDEA